MKTLLTICLLAMSAGASAQSAQDEKAQATRADAQSEAEEAKTRKQLADARERLDKAAREVAELSTKLGERTRGQVMQRIETIGPPRAILGVQIDSDPSKQGARVLNVSPGGPAEAAGLRDKDVIVAIDGVELTGAAPDRTLVTKMREVKPEQKVKVRVLRDGKRKDYVVIARGAPERNVYFRRNPEAGATGVGAGGFGGAPMIHTFRNFLPGEFEGLELASITPKLGAYFGVTEGVLVVQAPKDGAFKLEEGDVLQSIDGRKPEDGAHALRILRSYKSGEKLNLTVLRQRKPVTVAVTMPERPGADFFHFEGPGPMMAPMPPEPAGPAGPAIPLPPPGAGSFE
jgi:C-terminal processing protease CtpA/Prc